MSELRTCAKRFGGLAVTTLPRWAFSFIYPALPTCLVVYVQKSDFPLINVFCVVIAVKNVDYFV